VNGSIDAALGESSWSGALAFTTVNGEISLSLPSDVGASVEAETVNGHISSAFPLEIRGRFGPRRMTGTIGSGGGELQLETVNGDIRLERAAS
nr:DUF4097 family beta strand repeat protein [Gemmatimonadota bacterium]